ELHLVDRIKTVSTVSGGSVFGASWMAARARGLTDEAFSQWMRDILLRGFIRPALGNPRALEMLLPEYSRTHLLADTFDELLFASLDLGDLPERPMLCINTAVLNHAVAGRFSRGGYSGDGVGERTEKGYPEGPVAGVTLGF